MSKITIYRDLSPSVEEKKSSKKKITLCFSEFRSWIRSGKIFSHFFRYKNASLVVYDFNLTSKPLICSILTKCLARKQSVRIDRNGFSQNITIPFLITLFRNVFRDFLSKNSLLRTVQSKVKTLEKASKEDPMLNLELPPVYLRTDFCFGLQSGGSVGHIAGILNNLHRFTLDPIFLTTDRIPTVNPHLEEHIILPRNRYWDFHELPSLDFNETFVKGSLKILKDRKISFIYQRYSLNNFSGIELSQHFRVPFVLEFNGSEIWVNRHWGNHKLKYEALSNEIEMLNLKKADLIVVVSRPIQEQLVAKGIDSDKILINPNGVDTEKYNPSIDGNPVREKYHLQTKIVIGFIGTFGIWHGAQKLASAFKMLLEQYPEMKAQIMLLMIGDGIMMPKVREILTPCIENCILTGTIRQELGPSYLAACDLLVSPHVCNADGSPFFGSPTKLFEYMAMGKGIIASNLDQIGEVLKHNHSGWMVEPGNVEELMLGMKKLIDEPVLRNRLGQFAREEVCSQYTWENHTRKIMTQLEAVRDTTSRFLKNTSPC